MRSPYRETDNAPPAPLEELKWRRRVGRIAGWAELIAIADAIVLRGGSLLPARFALPSAVAWFVVSAALCVATWMYMAPRPRSALGWRGWLVRAGMPLCLGVTGMLLLGVHVELGSFVLGTLLAVLFVTGVPYTSPYYKQARAEAGLVVLYAVSAAMFFGLPNGPFWRICGLFFVFFSLFGGWALRSALLPVQLHWWFDNRTGTPGEWLALLVYQDGRTEPAEARWTDERSRWFASKDAALSWLKDNGCLPAERALAEHLVDSVPPDILPVAHRRKRLRVEHSEPRVRVAAGTEDAEDADPVGEAALGDADAVDEPALDEAEQVRAATVPRADE